MFQRYIYYVSAECGAGKSHGACCYIKDNLFQQNYVYVAPSLHLVSEIAGRLEEKGVTPRVITRRYPREGREEGHHGGVEDSA
jgi:hypothetical protein